ncbi:hypothetical protein BJ742DRAFT_902380 [Cladochytrium replicatum]|nr:hypothetical protein BJ742DRAFT_902380 [Cladochytrium replicatum]
MASQVTVELDWAPSRRTVVKVTPAMNLKAIVAAACEKLKENPSQPLGLRYHKNTLDLSLSVRFANLPPDAKPVIATVAVQVPDQPRLMDKFAVKKTLWQVLLHFEALSGETLNLTRRTGVPPTDSKPGAAQFFKAIADLGKKAEPFYMIPVCVVMNVEYNTVEALQKTTLEDAGITTNGIIRILFRFSEQTLVQMLPIIDREFPNPRSPTVAQIPARVASVKYADIEVPDPAPKPVEVSEAKSMELDAPLKQAAHAAAEYSSSSTIGNTSTVIAEPMQEESTGVAEADVVETSADAVEAMAVDSQQRTAPMDSENLVRVDTPSAATKAHGHFSQPASFERDLHVYRPPPEENVAPVRIELPDSFFELSGAEISAILQSAKSHRAHDENRPLMTRSMREKELELRQKKWPKTLIRVRLPDRTTLQATFYSGDPLLELYNVVRQSLATPAREFYLYVTPPQKTIPDTSETTFWKESLAPQSIVYFSWRDGEKSGPYLSNDMTAKLEDLPKAAVPDVQAGTPAPEPTIKAQEHTSTEASGEARTSKSGTASSTIIPPRDDGPKVPKWFKLGKKT